MNGAIKALAGALLAVGLASCASGTPPDTFEIKSPATTQPAPRRTRAQLLIPEPTALKTLDSENIVVKTSPYALQYLSNSQWSDRLPKMVQLRLLQAFENTGRVGAVGVPGQGLAIDYQVIPEIRRFEIMAGPAPTAVVEISIKALNDRNGSVLRTRVFSAQVPVTGTTNGDYVAALNEAYERVADQIVSWTLGIV